MHRSGEFVDVSDLTCDATFEESCYLLMTEQLVWAEARERCLLFGGRLVSIESEAENSVIERQSTAVAATTPASLLALAVDGVDARDHLEQRNPRTVTHTLDHYHPVAFDAEYFHGESGIDVSEIFPHVAKHVDKLAVVRSMHADVPNHEPSLMLMNCGEARAIRPSM